MAGIQISPPKSISFSGDSVDVSTSTIHLHPDQDMEDDKLLQFRDSLDDSELTWTGGNAGHMRQPVKRVLIPLTVRGWISLGLVALAASLLGGLVAYSFKSGCTEQQCIRMSSSYSPMLDAVRLTDYQFEAELGAENVFKGHPRPELDIAWDRVGRIHPISMPDKYRAVLNKTDSGIPYPEELGGGIMVEIEVFHQLHCLNFLRKVIYADYYSRPENIPKTFQVGNTLLFNHVDHCIDYLRQFIMCAGDVTPVTSNWVQTHHTPHPDFNTMHKCRNFDELLEWVEKNDNGGVPRQTPNPSWWPAPKLADTILDFEPDYPIPPHGPPGKSWGSDDHMPTNNLSADTAVNT